LLVASSFDVVVANGIAKLDHFNIRFQLWIKSANSVCGLKYHQHILNQSHALIISDEKDLALEHTHTPICLSKFL
jgi:hypothetical protein